MVRGDETTARLGAESSRYGWGSLERGKLRVKIGHVAGEDVEAAE